MGVLPLFGLVTASAGARSEEEPGLYCKLQPGQAGNARGGVKTPHRRMGEGTGGESAQRLRALYQAGLAVAADLSVDAVLQRVVDLARELSGARYGALRVLGSTGQEEQFISSGITRRERARIGHPPQGRGLLGEVLRTGQPLRVPEFSKHPASVGFPPGHPPMTSFLGVPISYRGSVLGIIYLTDKLDAPEFTEEDAELLGLFAAQAAVAIENARLYTRVKHLAIEEERQRIAREMHDSLAQILGYVNVKAGAARRLIARGRRGEAERALVELDAAAQSAYADVREAILGLRAHDPGRGRQGSAARPPDLRGAVQPAERRGRGTADRRGGRGRGVVAGGGRSSWSGSSRRR